MLLIWVIFPGLFLPLITIVYSYSNDAHDDQIPLIGAETLPQLDLLQTSIREIQELLSDGRLTSVQLVETYLARIERDNHQGLNLKAVIQSAPRQSALEIAFQLDEERSKGRIRSELHGIPILVKDNIATDLGLGMRTTAGSLGLKGSIVRKDAFVIENLRKAGAILIAKTNLNELAGWKGILKGFLPITSRDDSPKANVTFRGPTNGWSAVGGQCSSAYVEGGFDQGGDPMGSSSGSAVGLSVGWGAAAVGTDTLGSVLGPASRAALYAIRPTLGRVSRKGVVPVSLDHDTIGPMGFTTWDVALMLEIMSGEDQDDQSTHDIPPLSNLTSIVSSPPNLSEFTIGIPTRYFSDEPFFEIPSGRPSESEIKFSETLHHLQTNYGLNLKWNKNINLSSHKDIQRFLEVLTDKINIDFRADMDDYLTNDLEESKVRNMLELAMFNDKYSSEELPPNGCCQERILTSLTSSPRNSTEHQQLRSELKVLADERSLGHIFDAIALDFELGAPGYWVGAAVYPAGVVPLGYCSNSLPYGLMFVTRKYDEQRLIGLMAAYEKVMPKRRVPKPYQERYWS
ncbi:hypothetical protein I203_106503 [Kwoniella mangroviensis CBS 8507]|uniref:uncharacterized protein n=1 Tax=Kwoniella mangroviensis CBS 8507 TaxID=1296122 RepID=UPI00080CF3B6|nr:uncharacterized protein I203_07001 [Kwoniella mangroviensis CBS 8507]OCF64044.1 hypothetical protein I203_07001 [Kwoniella mangroviensis CBS 8507]